MRILALVITVPMVWVITCGIGWVFLTTWPEIAADVPAFPKGLRHPAFAVVIACLQVAAASAFSLSLLVFRRPSAVFLSLIAWLLIPASVLLLLVVSSFLSGDWAL